MTPLTYAALAWTLGIALARWLEPPTLLLAALAVPSFAWLVLGLRDRANLLAPTLLLLVLLGGARYDLSRPAITEGHIASFNDSDRLSVMGYVSAEPVVRDRYTQLQISALTVTQNGVSREVEGKLLTYVPRYAQYEYGDVLELAGKLETPPIFESFDYREYLASQGIHSQMRRPEVTRLPGRQGSRILRQMFAFKRRFQSVIETILPDPDSGLAAGILLGLGHTLPDDLYEAFRIVGLAHIIIISGANVSLLLQAAMLSAGQFLHRWIVLALSLALLALYTLFVGPSPPVVRAALMGGLFVLAQLLGRRSHALTTLAASTIVMTAWNPLTLLGASFQLTLASTLGLVLLQPLLARLVAWWRERRGFGDRGAGAWTGLQILLTTLAAQMATLPVLWYHFGRVSLIAPLANLLVLPVQPPLMILGLLVTLAGALWFPLGQALGWLLWPLTRYSIVVAQELARLPWADVKAPRLAPEIVVGVVSALVMLLSVGRRLRAMGATVRRFLVQRRTAQMLLLLMALLAISVWVSASALPDGRMHLYVLDVGQGDAILIRTPAGRAVLVDGGPDPVTLAARLGQILPFWQRDLDLVVATHADSDHLAGLLPIVERYRVGRALEPPTMGDSALSEAWRAALKKRGVPLATVSCGMEVRLGQDVVLRVLHPEKGTAYTGEADDNRQSLVLRLSMGRCHMLLTGDVDASGEAELLKRGELSDIAVLKVAHHGAGSSSSAPFLRAVSPRVALISVGEENRFGHPAGEVLQRLGAVGCQVYRTDWHGTIECITDGERVWVKTQRREKVRR